MGEKRLKYSEFIEKYEVDEHDEWFLPRKVFEYDVKFQGWRIKEVRYLKEFSDEYADIDVVCTNPNFYYDGYVLAESRASIIMASGYSRFKTDDKEYTDFKTWFTDNTLSDLSSIVWEIQSDWIIVSKKTSNLLGQFDDWNECPRRKEVE